MTEIKKICKKHGELIPENIRVYETKDRGRSVIAKRCRICHRETASVSRNRDRTKANEWTRNDRKNNPEKYREYVKRCRRKDPVRRISVEIARRRGMKPEDYLSLFEKQKNKCAICNNEETRKFKNGKIMRLVMDHCHTTNKNRELLCHACNIGIGKFNDSPELLKKAISYLKKHSE